MLRTLRSSSFVTIILSIASSLTFGILVIVFTSNLKYQTRLPNHVRFLAIVKHGFILMLQFQFLDEHLVQTLRIRMLWRSNHV